MPSSRTTSRNLGPTEHFRAAAGSSNAAAADLGTAALIRTRRETSLDQRRFVGADGFCDYLVMRVKYDHPFFFFFKIPPGMEMWEDWDNDSTTGLHLVGKSAKSELSGAYSPKTALLYLTCWFTPVGSPQ